MNKLLACICLVFLSGNCVSQKAQNTTSFIEYSNPSISFLLKNDYLPIKFIGGYNLSKVNKERLEVFNINMKDSCVSSMWAVINGINTKEKLLSWLKNNKCEIVNGSGVFTNERFNIKVTKTGRFFYCWLQDNGTLNLGTKYSNCDDSWSWRKRPNVIDSLYRRKQKK